MIPMSAPAFGGTVRADGKRHEQDTNKTSDTPYCRSGTRKQADTMPLLKIFTQKALTVSANTLHKRLTAIWKVPEDVLKVLVVPTFDSSGNGDIDNDIYVDVRAKAKPERTKEVIDEAMINTQDLLKEHGYKATIRVELYEPSLQSALKAV